MALKGHPKGCAPRHVTVLAGKNMGYADGGMVNTFRSDSEKKVDGLYGKPAPDPAPNVPTQQLNAKIKAAGG